jgi:hypothetical protein
VSTGADHPSESDDRPVDDANTPPVDSTDAGSNGGDSGRSVRQRLLGGLHETAHLGAATGARAAAQLSDTAAGLRLEVVATGLKGERVLIGHAQGMHLLLPAEGVHGPREAPALVYLFGDALAIRPTDDAPMSTVPLYGLHMILPPVAVGRWLYKSGRIAHANFDLARDAQHLEESLPAWTVDDFAEADEKLTVYRASALTGPLHVFEHLGYARLWADLPGTRPLRMKSALPAGSETFGHLESLFRKVDWPHGVTTALPEDRRGTEDS